MKREIDRGRGIDTGMDIKEEDIANTSMRY